ncbi:uncharacterized protein LOC115622206 [Scaptodrosophila lebanonensis]|uniref:Uncharacterized protein LOC115622206 n=1 Tax=Drosophila lebanonensis TaxID=7225 RepID=A0A6J2TAH6_DROLE|nr:uncharacterized protein LOC115622206 [Scaptodrosophila lebanonensis]
MNPIVKVKRDPNIIKCSTTSDKSENLNATDSKTLNEDIEMETESPDATISASEGKRSVSEFLAEEENVENEIATVNPMDLPVVEGEDEIVLNSSMEVEINFKRTSSPETAGAGSCLGEDKEPEKVVDSDDVSTILRLPSRKGSSSNLSSSSRGSSTSSSSSRQTRRRRPPVNQSKMTLKWNLRAMISNLYMNVESRLPNPYVSKCLWDTSYCVSNHRRAVLPNAPSFSTAQNLSTTLKEHLYETYLDLLQRLILQGTFPDENLFDTLIELAMVLVAKELELEEVKVIYRNLKDIFFLLVDAFPPCWTALRPYYLNFLGINTNGEIRSKQTKPKLDFYLDLLKQTIIKCTDKELSELTPYSEKMEFNFSEDEDADISQETLFARHVDDYEWNGTLSLDVFDTMSPAVRLARLFDVLYKLYVVLERDFIMWLDHNKLRQAEAEIFNEDTCPFSIIVFGFTSTTRLTPIVRQLMTLYGHAASRFLNDLRLGILEKFISLLMELSNTAELEYVNSSVRYPNLGPQTRLLIAEFFKIFKAENPSRISTYIHIIPQLGQPYVRFEFTNLFLELFYFSKKLKFCPEKLCEEIKTKQWQKYMPRKEIGQDNEELLAREDYLRLCLNGLRDYCNWMNLEGFWKCLKHRQQVEPLQVQCASPLATPVGVVSGDVGKIFMLDEMEKEAHTWPKRINANVILAKPRVNLPMAKVDVIEMCKIYADDMRYLRYLRRLLVSAQNFYKDLDLREWMKFLDFLGDDEPNTTETTEEPKLET